ncbi:MAG: BrnT family toxin [Mariprofundaceae bacterium]|nr:BrnT family toxin [Mariprofundaceae bacterium]
MEFEWNEEKCKANRVKHGIDFDVTADFDWSLAWTKEDKRLDYGEPRYISIGPIRGRLHIMVWTLRGDVVRIINFRKANRREVRDYVSQT